MTTSQKFINDFIVKYSKKIRSMVEWKAYRFFIDADDLHGELNLSISRIYIKSAFDGTETHFWRYIHLSIHTSAIDLKRRRVSRWKPDPHLDIDEVQETDHLSNSVQPDLNLKLLVKRICTDFPLTFRKDTWRVVWEEHFINGLPYDEVAVKANIPLGTVKTIIFKIKEYASREYLEEYKEAI